MAERDKLDIFLDRALREYSQASPPLGFERRILANLEVHASNRRAFAWPWIAIPALAILVLCAFLIGSHYRSVKKSDAAVVQQRHNTITGTKPRVVEPAVAKASVELPKSHKVRMQSFSPTPKASEPRLATFPSSTGDDDLVRLAVRFAQAHPAVATKITQEQQEFREMAETFTAPLMQNNQQQ